MKIFGFALAASIVLAATAPSQAMPPAPFVGAQNALLHEAAYGDAPMPGRHRGGRRGRASAKPVEPAIPSMKGVSQESADKQYKSKYGF